MPSRGRALVIAALLLAGCSGSPSRLSAAPPSSALGYQATGFASWYGDELAGARTASGARFDPDGISAAHRSLPLGSFVEVTALDTGRSILVMVNDRGPHRADRLIDLSRGAAQALGMRTAARVRVRAVMPTPTDAERLRRGQSIGVAPAVPDDLAAAGTASLDPFRRYIVQVASFASEDRARSLAASVGGETVRAGSLWRVRVGPLTAAAAQARRDAVAARGYGDAQILPVSGNNAPANTEER